MSPTYDGIKINELASGILNSLELDILKDAFLCSIYSQGFLFSDNYDEYVYEQVSMTRYLVDKSFPKLIKESVNEAIIKAQYELSLAVISAYIIE